MQGEIRRSREIGQSRREAGQSRRIGPVTTSTVPWRTNPLSQTGRRLLQSTMRRNRSQGRPRQLPPSRPCRFRCTGASLRQLRRTVLRRLLCLRLRRASRNQAIILRRPNLLAAGQGTIHQAALLVAARRTRAEAIPAVAVAEVAARTVVAVAAARTVVVAAAVAEAAANTETDLRQPEPRSPAEAQLKRQNAPRISGAFCVLTVLHSARFEFRPFCLLAVLHSERPAFGELWHER
jgi:hypothetical protein